MIDNEHSIEINRSLLLPLLNLYRENCISYKHFLRIMGRSALLNHLSLDPLTTAETVLELSLLYPLKVKEEMLYGS